MPGTDLERSLRWQGNRMKKTALLVILFNLLPLLVWAAPQAELWPRWQAYAARSTLRVDQRAWAAFLEKYLSVGKPDAPNLVRYGAVTRADRKSLDAYLAMLGRVPVAKLNRAEQRAYWINLYNALTVRTILDHFPVESIRDIKSGWFSAGPWDLKLIAVDGVKLSLNDIEHRILRPIWRDNRIHYAVNCASLGCPKLQPEPFTAENSDRLLDRAAREYVNSPRGVRFDGTSLVVSRIYDWYQADFGGSEQGVLQHLERYADPQLASRLKNYRGSLAYDYAWRLNGKPGD